MKDWAKIETVLLRCAAEAKGSGLEIVCDADREIDVYGNVMGVCALEAPLFCSSPRDMRNELTTIECRSIAHGFDGVPLRLCAGSIDADAHAVGQRLRAVLKPREAGRVIGERSEVP